MTDDEAPVQPGGRSGPLVLIVSGMSGAGRQTTINALEDMGYETLDNFPISLFPMLVEPGANRAMAIGVDTRTRGFSVRALTEGVELLRRRDMGNARLLFLDCADEVLVSRFSETRRRHPLAPAEDALTGIRRERDVLEELRHWADAVIDTTEFSPRDLKRRLEQDFSLTTSQGLAVLVQSFSYKRGTPHEADMVIDCRFLRNPYWDEDLRHLDGRDERIQAFVREDDLFAPFFDRLAQMITLLLPAYRAEGKSYFCVALGCTGGRHRSVTVAEELGARVAEAGWSVQTRHRELERKRT